VKRGIDDIVKFRDQIPGGIKPQTDPFINGILLKGLVAKKKQAGLTDQAEYIQSKIPTEDKKGF
jgi:aminopeptidase N